MKLRFWTIVFVIILVYIHWLSEGHAQTTADQVRLYNELMKAKNQPTPTQTESYSSPPMYETDIVPATDTLPDFGDMATDSADAASADSITPPTKSQLIRPDGKELTRFGNALFSNPPVGEINPASVPEEYLLGPGDNIIISLWGRVQQEWNVTVDRMGKIFIPKVGEVSAWGMTLNEFTRSLDTHISRVYTGYERRVTLGKIRIIKVFVYGEVTSPGGYAISALSTVFNALYMAGGPSGAGSLRQIKLIRNNKTTPIDLYDFLIAGDKSCDIPLQSGDVIFIPLVGPQARIRGEVKRPGIYELTGAETVVNLIDLAGGFTADAYLGRLMLDRVGETDARRLTDIDFTAETLPALTMLDGDDLSVFSIYHMRENIVWVDGMVKHPGTFERFDGMRVSDLIDRGQLQSNNVFMSRADLYRHLPGGHEQIVAVDLNAILEGDSLHDIRLTNLDSLYIYSTDEVVPRRHVFIDGMVQNPGAYPLYSRMTVADLIFLAGNLQESAYLLEAELARIDSTGATSLIKVPLDRIENGTEFFLRENDHLFVRKTPGYELHRMVTIEGEVLFPGKYSLSRDNETLWGLFHRAGGFSDQAFPIGAVFKRRAIVEDLERKDINAILNSSLPLLADSTGELRPQPSVEFEPRNMDRIIIDMERLIATGGQEGNFKLQSGDYIYVPEIPTGISVLGEVSANGTIKYHPDRKVKYYLEQAGGFTKRADKGEMRLVKANGRVYADNVRGRKVNLGDVIVVPAEVKKEKDWLKFVSASLSILTGVATSILIIDRL